MHKSYDKHCGPSRVKTKRPGFYVQYCLYVVISQCVGRSKKPPGRYYSYHSVITIISPYPDIFKVVVLTHTYLQLLITKVVHTNTFLDKGSSTREQALWEINKLYPIHLYGILVINTRPRLRLVSCNNKDTILILEYN